MTFDWPVTSFADLIRHGELEIGDGYRAKNDELGGLGLIFLRAGHVTASHIDFHGVDRFLSDQAERFGPKISRLGDVIITTKGNSTGRVAFVDADMPKFVYSPHLSYWRASSSGSLDQAYLRAWSRGPEFLNQLTALSRSTDMAPYLSLTDQRRITIKIPPRQVQSQIGHFNDAISGRIDLLRQTNATLEAIAQALFKSWFVDFDPVRAKAEGREPEGMDAATAALFPSEFEDSGLEPTPKGWHFGALNELADLNASKWSARKHPAIIRYIDLSGVTSNRIDDAKEYAFDEAPSRARHHLREGDTIVGTVRPGNRAFAYIHSPEPNLTGSTGFAVLSPRSADYAGYIYLAATRNESIERLTNLADGAAYPAVRPGIVADTPCVIANDGVIKAFSAVIRPILERIAQGRETAETLADLRDTLLPRLISGKLRLPEAEALTDEVREVSGIV